MLCCVEQLGAAQFTQKDSREVVFVFYPDKHRPSEIGLHTRAIQAEKTDFIHSAGRVLAGIGGQSPW